MRIFSLQDLLIWKPAPVKQVIGSGVLLAQTKLVIFGAPKTMKSLIAQQLAFCLGTGSPWLGFSTEMSRILYVQGEISQIPFRGRVVQMSRNATLPPNALHFATEFGLKLDRDSGMDELKKGLDSIARRYKAPIEVLMVDPLYKFVSDSSESSIQRMVDNLDILLDRENITLVMVHHSRKAQLTSSGAVVDMGGAELRGPLIEQWADSIIRVRGDISSDHRVLDFELRNATSLLNPINIELDRKRLWFNTV